MVSSGPTISCYELLHRIHCLRSGCRLSCHDCKLLCCDRTYAQPLWKVCGLPTAQLSRFVERFFLRDFDKKASYHLKQTRILDYLQTRTKTPTLILLNELHQTRVSGRRFLFTKSSRSTASNGHRAYNEPLILSPRKTPVHLRFTSLEVRLLRPLTLILSTGIPKKFFQSCCLTQVFDRIKIPRKWLLPSNDPFLRAPRL